MPVIVAVTATARRLGPCEGSWAAVAFAVGLLAACSASTPDGGSAGAKAGAPAISASAAAPASAPTPVEVLPPPGASAAAAPGAELAPEATGDEVPIQAVATIDPVRLPEPRQLVGLTADEVTARLGTPGFRRRDEPAEIWQYRDASCLLDLFLYRQGGGLRVAHVEVRARGKPEVDGRLCLQALARKKPRPGAG